MSKRNLSLVIILVVLGMLLGPVTAWAQTETVTKIEVRTGRVMKAAGGVLIINVYDGPNAGYQKITYDTVPENVTLYRGGQQVGIEDLRTGDVIKGVITHTEERTISMTREDVVDEVGTEVVEQYEAPPEVKAEPMPAKLPKTGSPLGLLLLVGAGSLAGSAGLRKLRNSPR